MFVEGVALIRGDPVDFLADLGELGRRLLQALDDGSNFLPAAAIHLVSPFACASAAAELVT